MEKTEFDIINVSNQETSATTIIRDEKTLSILDEIINQYGYGINNWKNFFVIFLILAIEGYHLTFFGTLYIPIQGFYSLNDNEMQIFSSLIFPAVALGSLSCGYLSDYISRRNLLISLQLIITVAQFIIGITNQVYLFIILRTIIGFGVGVLTPISINIFTEYLPMANRAIMLIIVWIGFSFGQIALLFIMLFTMPNLESNGFQKTILISTAVPLLSFLVSLIFLRDSPRNLIITGNEEEAYKILEKLNGQSITEIKKTQIVKETKTGLNTNLDVKFKEIFNNDLLKITILLLFIWVINSLINYGPFLITSLTMKDIGIKEEKFSNNQIIINQLYIAFIGCIANFIGGYLCELSFFGRNKANLIANLIALSTVISLILIKNYFGIIFGIYGAFSGMSFNIASTYSAEVYPTKIRDLALGFLFFMTRLGGFISQIIYIYFHKMGTWIPYIITCSLIIINMLLIFMLPIETYKRPLDSKESNRFHKEDDEDEKNNNEIEKMLKVS